MKTITRKDPLSPEIQIDELVRKISKKKIEKDVREYLALLDSKAHETKIHSFLASHSYFFNGILDLNSYSPLYSKIKLGDDYEVDFAWLKYDSFGPEWKLVELEAANRVLFTKSGNPSAALTHAIQQVRDWHGWIHDHGEYARKIMPRIAYPLGFVFLGRRRDITATTQEKLKRLRYENRSYLAIHSLDWFANAALRAINFLGATGGNWLVPMKAFSHRELKRGLPAPAHKWIEIETPSRLINLRRQQREHELMNPREFGFQEQD